MNNTDQETVGTLGDCNFDVEVDCGPGRVGGGSSNFAGNGIIFLPRSGDPAMFGKILPDFRNGNRGFLPVEYHEYSIGPKETDKRFFFSPRCWGEQDEMTKLFWDAIKERKKFYENKEGPDFRYWDAIMKATRPKKGALLYWIGRGENKIQYLFLKEPAADVLFGSPVKKDARGNEVPAIPGLVKEMREMGLSPFNLKDSAGWVKLYKTGTGPSTQFHAELDQQKVEEMLPNGRRKFSLEPTEAAIDPAILKIDPKKVTPLTEVAKERGWTIEEIASYIQSDFTQIPERFMRRANSPGAQRQREASAPGGEKVASAVEKAYESIDNVEQATEDDLPF